MKLSEFIEKLQNQIAIIGDVDVFSESRNEFGDVDEYSYVRAPLVFTTNTRRREDDWKIDPTIAVIK